MAKIPVPLFQQVTLRIDDQAVEHFAQTLDVDGETLLLRVSPAACGDETPERVTLSYGHQNFFWEVTAEAKAVYDQWWFVDRPDELDCKRYQRRQFVRINYQTELLAVVAGEDGLPVTLETKNLSAGGCLATSETVIGERGEELMVFLSLPEMPPLATASEVVRVAPDAQGRHRYGIRFKDLKDGDREQVAHFIAKQIQSKLTRGQDITTPEA